MRRNGREILQAGGGAGEGEADGCVGGGIQNIIQRTLTGGPIFRCGPAVIQNNEARGVTLCELRAAIDIRSRYRDDDGGGQCQPVVVCGDLVGGREQVVHGRRRPDADGGERSLETLGVGRRQEQAAVKRPQLLGDGRPEHEAGVAHGKGQVGTRDERPVPPRHIPGYHVAGGHHVSGG